MSIRNLFEQSKPVEESNPFIGEGDVVLENGNSKSPELSRPKPKRPGFKAFDRRSKSLQEQMAEREDFGLPEDGAGKKKRKKKVSHKARAIKYLEDQGWMVMWVEKFVVSAAGYGFHQDFRGMWDARCQMAGQPELRVNVCGGQKDRLNHIRKFCCPKLIKRFREDLENTKVICALLGFEPVQKGKSVRYEPVFQRLTIRDLEQCLARRRKAA